MGTELFPDREKAAEFPLQPPLLSVSGPLRGEFVRRIAAPSGNCRDERQAARGSPASGRAMAFDANSPLGNRRGSVLRCQPDSIQDEDEMLRTRDRVEHRHTLQDLELGSSNRMPSE